MRFSRIAPSDVSNGCRRCCPGRVPGPDAPAAPSGRPVPVPPAVPDGAAAADFLANRPEDGDGTAPGGLGPADAVPDPSRPEDGDDDDERRSPPPP
mmetsp:Transcript_10008/g.21607  ORF Transcript_10008/g.21607 Transcript_10008/m.21607 type:complete len:96 (-) Transcript_10008:276-563(-)